LARSTLVRHRVPLQHKRTHPTGRESSRPSQFVRRHCHHPSCARLRCEESATDQSREIRLPFECGVAREP
jgi:hypothetical protein